MLNQIINFIEKLNPALIIQAPSRINLINPLDAVEGAYWMPSVAINGYKNPLSTFIYIKEIQDKSRIKFYKLIKARKNINLKLECEDDLPKNMTSLKEDLRIKTEINLVLATIYRFAKTNSYFWECFTNKNIELGVISTIPRQSGLGGSASIIIGLIFGLAKYFKIYNNKSCLKDDEFPINRDIIAEVATKVEDSDLNITAGYSDRYTISRGGLGFCSYIGKLYHKNISMEPLAVYDRIDKIYNIKNLPLIVCYSGVLHDSGSVHKKLRALYLNRELNIRKGYKKLAKIAWKSRFALMKQDWKLLGQLFKMNSDIMNRIMKASGFKYGIGLINNLLIKLIEDHPDVYAVKLTGAGGGGSVFALVNPNRVNYVMDKWKRRLNYFIENPDSFKEYSKVEQRFIEGLKDAEFFRIKISKSGVKRL